MAAAGCSASSDAVGESALPVVYGDDDRKEFFEITDPDARRMVAQSMVALVPRSVVAATPGALIAKTWGELENLCPGEPFADQPSAAFCTGVLVDWDLILTAGHCARVLALEDIAVVFDYHYEAPGQLAFSAGDTAGIVEIVAEALDPRGIEPRLDYAWFRLDAAVGPPRRPAAVVVERPPDLSVGDPIISVGAGGGVPIKLDAGAKLRQLREPFWDYFLADADTSRGSSGGGAFTPQLALLGVLARGGPDFIDRGDGCRTTIRATEDLADEQFTYAQQAVRALCEKRPGVSSLCRPQCGVPCRALPLPVVGEDGSCAMARRREPANSHFGLWFGLGAPMLLALRRSWRRRTSPRRWPAVAPVQASR